MAKKSQLMIGGPTWINPILTSKWMYQNETQYLSEAWMCSEFGINNTDVEQERVEYPERIWFFLKLFYFFCQAPGQGWSKSTPFQPHLVN